MPRQPRTPYPMRTVRVAEPDSGHTWLWLTAGAALGVVAGVLLADRIKARKGSLSALANRGRQLAATAKRTWGPLLETAQSLKEAWNEPDEDEGDVDDDLEYDELDEEVDDALDARVLEAFIHDPILVERSVEIEERDPGVIVLHGRMLSASEVKHASTIARGVPGVERVRSRLTVRERLR